MTWWVCESVAHSMPRVTIVVPKRRRPIWPVSSAILAPMFDADAVVHGGVVSGALPAAGQGLARAAIAVLADRDQVHDVLGGAARANGIVLDHASLRVGERVPALCAAGE